MSDDSLDTDQARDRIDTYFRRAVDPDRDAYLALFADDVVVEDEGRERVGIDAVREWRGEVPEVVYTVREVLLQQSSWVATTTIAGDFPGSPVDLGFAFRFDAAGRVVELRIRT